MKKSGFNNLFKGRVFAGRLYWVALATICEGTESATASATPKGCFQEALWNKKGPFGAKGGLLFTVLYDAQTLSQLKHQGMPVETSITPCHF